MPRERPVPASMLAPVRRILADSVAQERPVDRTATTTSPATSFHPAPSVRRIFRRSYRLNNLNA